MSTPPAWIFRTTCLFFLLAPPTWAAPPRMDDHGDPLPPGAVARLGTVRLRHGTACVAFSPDGKTLVTGGDVGLLAWDVATGKDLGWFPTAAGATSAQFTPDGKAVLTTDNNGSIRLWQAGTGKLLREKIHTQDNRDFHAYASFLSANGKVAGVTGMGDGVRLWETETGKQLFTRKKQPPSLFFSAALSPDGKTVVVGGEENRAHVLDAATGKEVRTIEGPNKAPHLVPGYARWREEAVYWFTFSPDGRTLAAVSGKDSFSVWNVADGRRRFTIKGCRGHLAFSPDGKRLVCGDEETIRLYETETGKEVRRFERYLGYVRTLGFSPDGKTVAASHLYTIVLWDVATGKRLHRVAGHATPVMSLAFSPNGDSLASSDETLIVWRLKDRKPQHTFAGHVAAALSIAYSPDGKILATGNGIRGTGGFDARIGLWDLSAGRLLRQFPAHLNGVESLAFSPDGKRLASIGHDARAKVWEVSTGKRLLQIRGEDTSTRSIAFSPDGKTLLTAGSPGELTLWQADSGRKTRDLGSPGDKSRTIAGAAFLPGGRTALSVEWGNGSSKFHEVRFWAIETGRLRRSLSLGDADLSPSCLALSPDGKTLATVGDYRNPVIQLWDTTTGKQMGQFSGHNGGGILSLAFSPDGMRLASGGWDATVLLWDVTQARLLGLWAKLTAGQNASAGEIRKLAATPEEAVPFLRDRLRRAAHRGPNPSTHHRPGRRCFSRPGEGVSRTRAPGGQGGSCHPAPALQGSPGPEARRRLQKAIDKSGPPPKEPDLQLRSVSLALAVLEEIGTPDARRALEELAKGPVKSMVTRDAGAALERLTKRRKP